MDGDKHVRTNALWGGGGRHDGAVVLSHEQTTSVHQSSQTHGEHVHKREVIKKTCGDTGGGGEAAAKPAVGQTLGVRSHKYGSTLPGLLV